MARFEIATDGAVRDINDAPDFELYERVIEDPHAVFWDLMHELYEALRPTLFDRGGKRIFASCTRSPLTWSLPKMMEKQLRGRPHRDLPVFTPVVGALAGIAWSYTGMMPDLCAVSLYRDGNDHVSPHIDFEGVTGPRAGNVVVPIFSFGQPRKMVFRKIGETERIVELELPAGSLLVMRGNTQRYWTHEIPIQGVDHPRISVSFIYDQVDPPENLAWALSDGTRILYVGPDFEVMQRWREHERDPDAQKLNAMSSGGEVHDRPPEEYRHLWDDDPGSAWENA